MAKIKEIPISENEVGYIFHCPGCNSEHTFSKNWTFNNDFDNPTISPSLLVRGWLNEKMQDGVCHSFIKEGKIQFLSDCLHELKNKTIELPEF